VFDALASLFLSRINEMGREDFTKIFYQELLLTMSKKKG